MKQLSAIISMLCLCVILISCEDDDKITLTVNTSAYEVFSTLKDASGNYCFTDKLPDGLEVRYSYVVVREPNNLSEDAEVVEKQMLYSDNIKSIVSYTTHELIPGIYRVYVTTDLIKGNIEYNALTIDQYLAPVVASASNSGVYNAFGDAAVADLLIEEKTEIDLDTQRKGTLMTLFFKNVPQSTEYSMQTEDYEFYSYDDRFSNNSSRATHRINSTATSAQHYCGSFSDFYISWDGGYKTIPLSNGMDKIVEMDYATNQITVK